MDARYEAYSFADPHYYDSPVTWGAPEEFTETGEPAPEGWERRDRGTWAGLHPVGVRFPDQGWKIHVSAGLANAEQVLATVHAYCLRERLPFKFLRGLPVLQLQNAKYAPRSGSGKFCTLYPLDEAQLTRCLEELGTALDGEPGPYVLSDLRWRQGPLYLRYGAFVERWLRSPSGVPELAFADPDGTLVPDVRAPVFELPAWAPVPEVLRETLESRRTAKGTGLPYRVERALHFSNAGGIYLARDPETDTRLVLKEARPYAGLDQRGTDAVARLHHEAEMLRRLDGVPEVPRLIAELTSWEHEFIAQEYVEGETLNAWLAGRYPLVHPDCTEAEVAAYAAEALELLAKVEAGLARIHERGLVFGDLHPHNLLVRPDGRIAFIDFELASPADTFVAPALGAAGFAVPGLTGREVDLRALAALRLWLFLPLQQLLAHDPGKARQLTEAAAARFPLPPDYAETTRRGLVQPAATAAPLPEEEHRLLLGRLDGVEPDWPGLRAALATSIRASATPDRTDRLFPGDIAQFEVDALSLAYGAAGVLYALHVTGAGTDPAHARWLIEAERRRAPRPGLYTGGHGVAYTLDLLGQREEARELLDRLLDLPLEAQGGDLAGGLPGTLLTLLHFARQAPELLDRAEAAAEALTRWQDKLAAPEQAPLGLLLGGAGQALALLRTFEATGRTELLDRAEQTLAAELDRCVTVPDGTLQVPDGTRVLPYLAEGGTGIGLVLGELLRHRPHSPLAGHSVALQRSAETEFVVQPSLFNGRAGLLLHLDRLRPRPAAVIDRHRRALALHAVPHKGGLAFPGEQLIRLSSDLATGTAGVLLALGAALAGTPGLPFTDPLPPAGDAA
ncbi:serine/threonine protein kinase [Kitasatospora sp. MMS16-BH015]|uniref:class III lanthionine synthetase LanKC n=1 Tax=Kitasatospora sp. MMS16-BH015 TaxID=2018025 RepID=UPI000CA1EF37|nr:class III lanthionine synthetase LanKC [Kitasatospora sp. MMS16-BH015]AUG80621.1 serine/threonine protein kinase [Kitasatospora sp. MMS16-BH015]